ncbi:DUF6266 family protein [Pedobacter gandavensis]|uniref:DUF6266 family protein n=1 Tax=Pedobacter gandavensis TaxID=2679963 RepID=UPI00292F8E00|nr:DUF6266 family protein [Pedobacter gandavensis]
MAIIKNILGVPNGKIGDMVFYQRKGKTICKTIGKTAQLSPLQLANCQAMSVTTTLLRHMLKFINLGYGLQAKGTDQHPHNLATAYHKKYALKGVYPNIEVDYAKVMLSQGDLSVITDIKVEKLSTGIQFSWDPKLNYKREEHDDLVMILLYFKNKKRVEEHLNAAKRSDGQVFLLINEEEILLPTAIYIALRSADGTQVSDSKYLGTLNDPEEDLG